jgi:hypothetical protein
MSKVVLLDTGPLGMVSHPRPNRDVVDWVRNLLQSGAEVLVPEIADYEVRRELLRANKGKGIKRLDELKKTMGYVPITTEAMLKATDFWAVARTIAQLKMRHLVVQDHAVDRVDTHFPSHHQVVKAASRSQT